MLSEYVFFVIKINNFWSAATGISAKTKALDSSGRTRINEIPKTPYPKAQLAFNVA